MEEHIGDSNLQEFNFILFCGANSNIWIIWKFANTFKTFEFLQDTIIQERVKSAIYFCKVVLIRSF